jgi:hypothetical protein
MEPEVSLPCLEGPAMDLTQSQMHPVPKSQSNTGWFKIIVGDSVAYNFQTRNNKIIILLYCIVLYYLPSTGAESII